MSFPRYPSYKDSGVEWLGEVPEHWGVSRLGFESWVRARLGWKGLKAEEYVDDGFAFLSTPNIKGLNIDFENVNFISQERFDESPEIKVREGDVLLAKDGSTLGTVNVVRQLPRPTTVNSSIAVITPNPSLNGVFLYYLFASSYMEQTIQRTKGGMGVPHLFQADLNKFYLPLPSPAEQTAIAEFLDRETGKIDELVAEQRRLMGLLKEKRQAVISHSVTCGLNPAAPLKPSGIEWLGDVPGHWKVVPLKHLVVASVAGPYGASLTKAMYSASGYRVYGQQQAITNDFSIGDYYITEEKYEEMRRYTVFPGDVLVSVMGTIGKVAVVPPDAEPGIINPRLVRYRCGDKVTPQFMQIVLMSAQHQELLRLESNGSTMDGLNMQILGDVPILVPPFAEQEAIVAHLDVELAKFDTLTAEAQRAIDLLQERRTALISAAVTGQIDVRADDPGDFAIVLRLPPVAAEPPLLEDRINGVPEMQRFWETCDPMDLPENPDVVVVMDWLNRMAEVGGFERSLEHLRLTHQDVVDQVLQPAESGNLKPLRAAHPLVLMQCLWRIGVQYERNGYDDLRRPILSEKPAAAGEFWRELRQKLIRGEERSCLMFATAGR